MHRAVYGEIVTFDNGAKGMVESVDPEPVSYTHLCSYSLVKIFWQDSMW